MSETWTVLRLLTWCRDYFADKNIDSPRLDAELLLAHVLGCDRVGLYLRYDQPLQPDELAQFRELVRRRAAREPVAHLLGTKEFYGLSFLTDRRALVPRPETEILVDAVLAALPADQPQRLCEIGIGSGCLAIALLTKRPEWTIAATDTSADALNLAGENATRHGVSERLELREVDLIADDAGLFDAVVSNPPYVPAADCETTMPEVARFDPRSALDGGADGLDIVRRLIARSPDHLHPGGLLALEIGIDQAAAVKALLTDDGRYEQIEISRDLAGIERVVLARTKES